MKMGLKGAYKIILYRVDFEYLLMTLENGEWQKNNQRAESPVSCESSITIEGMSRACRYSPEEKKERIERYRTKRNQRNFNKKIKVTFFLFLFLF